ncbi:MAG: hypothetical protein K1000chlam4_01065, partial [Chlamydiae bacterium]|nr:hypothetical protein [Chlamydiota bacterium]
IGITLDGTETWAVEKLRGYLIHRDVADIYLFFLSEIKKKF